MKKQNAVLWLAALGSFVASVAVCSVPFLANAFGFIRIGWNELAIAAAIGMLVIPIVEIVKLFQRIFARKKAQK
jgi:Ca2+-transporting ATPase